MVSDHCGTYLLTWTTYGTWLPGHKRGFVGRMERENGSHHARNRVGELHDRDAPHLESYSKSIMRGQRVVLSGDHARFCATEIDSVANRNGFVVRVASIMATHLHIVAKSDQHDGASLLQLLKGNLSRSLSKRFGRQDAPTWWTRHGSRRLLPNEFARDCAVRYVLTQAHPLVVMRETRLRSDASAADASADHAG